MTTELQHHYSARGGCRAAFFSRAGETLASGPAGTGKSRAALEKLLAVCLRNPGTRCLIVRKVRATLSSTALQTWRAFVGKEAIAAGHCEWFGGSDERPPGYYFQNGSSIAVGGLDKAIKIMSSEYDIIYVQEATELDKEDWGSLLTRLRNGNISYQQIIADCNPSFPTHWLYMRVQSGAATMFNTRHEDNPMLFDEDGTLTTEGRAYIEKLDALTGVMKQRLRYGLWVAAEGMVWDDYDPSVHVIDRLPEGAASWPRYWSIDFGFTNPFVLQCWAKDPDGRLYLYRELYRSKRLVEDHARDILNIVRPDGEWIEPKPKVIICDHDAEDRATFERHSGLHTIAAIKKVSGTDKAPGGIQAVAQRFVVQPDGKPRLYLVRNARLHVPDIELETRNVPTCTIEEIPGYVWDDTARVGMKEQPKKENDHGCDAMRYQVAYHDLKPKPDIRSFDAF
ncbi:MAG TPA: phage terminase large subunit [Terriglobales bacterium]|nr:phage terminase large subunit [Terriglobales bacterium]